MAHVSHHDLKTRVTPAFPPSRPPGCGPADVLDYFRTWCADFIAVCPENLLAPDDDGFPILSQPQRCGKCGLCSDVCTRGTIELTKATRPGLRKLMAAQGPSGHFRMMPPRGL